MNCLAFSGHKGVAKKRPFPPLGRTGPSGPWRRNHPVQWKSRTGKDGSTGRTCTLWEEISDQTKGEKEVTRALLLGARMLLVAKGIATRSKDATRGSWHYYILGAKNATSSVLAPSSDARSY